MTLCVCVVLSSIVQSSVVPQTDRPNASTAPWRFGWPLQILVKDDQCREDFMQKKKGLSGIPLGDTEGNADRNCISCNIYSAVHRHLSALHDLCRDTAHKRKRKQNISLKTHRRLEDTAVWLSAEISSGYLSVRPIHDAFRDNFQSVRHLNHLNCIATKGCVFQ